MRVCVGELVGAIVYAYIGGVVCVYKHTVTTAGFASTLSSLPPPPPPSLLPLLLLLLFHCIYRDIFCSPALLPLPLLPLVDTTSVLYFLTTATPSTSCLFYPSLLPLGPSFLLITPIFPVNFLSWNSGQTLSLLFLLSAACMLWCRCRAL